MKPKVHEDIPLGKLSLERYQNSEFITISMWDSQGQRGPNLLLQIIVTRNTDCNSSCEYLPFFQLVSLALFQWTLVKCNLILIILIKNTPTNVLRSSESTISPFLRTCCKTCTFLSNQILPFLLCHNCSTESSSWAFLPHFSTTCTQQSI